MKILALILYAWLAWKLISKLIDLELDVRAWRRKEIRKRSRRK